MKPTLLLTLIFAALACSHEHQNDRVIHVVIDDLNTPHIVDVNPPVSGDGRVKYGLLVGDDYLEKDYIKVTFSQEPHCLTVNDFPDPRDGSIIPIKPVIPVKEWNLSGKRLILHAPCSEGMVGGIVSVGLQWCAGDAAVATAWLAFHCTDY